MRCINIQTQARAKGYRMLPSIWNRSCKTRSPPFLIVTFTTLFNRREFQLRSTALAGISRAIGCETSVCAQPPAFKELSRSFMVRGLDEPRQTELGAARRSNFQKHIYRAGLSFKLRPRFSLLICHIAWPARGLKIWKDYRQTISWQGCPFLWR